MWCLSHKMLYLCKAYLIIFNSTYFGKPGFNMVSSAQKCKEKWMMFPNCRIPLNYPDLSYDFSILQFCPKITPKRQVSCLIKESVYKNVFSSSMCWWRSWNVAERINHWLCAWMSKHVSMCVREGDTVWEKMIFTTSLVIFLTIHFWTCKLLYFIRYIFWYTITSTTLKPLSIFSQAPYQTLSSVVHSPSLAIRSPRRRFSFVHLTLLSWPIILI